MLMCHVVKEPDVTYLLTYSKFCQESDRKGPQLQYQEFRAAEKELREDIEGRTKKKGVSVMGWIVCMNVWPLW